MEPLVAVYDACVLYSNVIVTFNTSDFPATALSPFGIIAAKPDTFVIQLMESGIVDSAAADHRASPTRPPMSVANYLAALGQANRSLPRPPTEFHRGGARHW
jgi:hypothetical protein